MHQWEDGMVRKTPMTGFVNDVISLGIFVELYAICNIRSTDNGEITPTTYVSNQTSFIFVTKSFVTGTYNLGILKN